MGSRTPSPLRYPGGKIRLANFIKQIMVDNNLIGGEYVEAYAGGAGIAWSLLFDDYVTKIHINDINKSISAFWYSVFHETESLCQLIRDTPITLQSWNKQKAIQKDSSNSTKLELGFSTFFLNRTNRSGIIGGGIIGGKGQDGFYKLDARYKTAISIKKIEKIATYKNKVKLYNLDAIKLINKIIPTIPQQSLIYLDPPYYNKGAELYENHYDHDGHLAIARTLSNIHHKWVISYDNVSQIQAMYKGYRKLVYQLKYSTATSRTGSEIIFFAPNLIVPKKQSPLLFDKPQFKQLQFKQIGSSIS
jgi:DNA adenine methylase